jgi:hypothetical protein
VLPKRLCSRGTERFGCSGGTAREGTKRRIWTKILRALEFDKIRARAADGIVCPEARGMLLGQPHGNADEVGAALEQTDAMTTLLTKTVRPVFPR